MTTLITGAVLRSSPATAPFLSSRPLGIEELDLDDPGEHELLVRIEAAGLCHSDLSVVDGNRPRPLPMLLGHEAAGIVERVGSGVSDLHQGQRVVFTFLPRCGQCEACATDGLLPCSAGSAANEAGTLLDGARRLHPAGQPAESVHHHLGCSAFATRAVVDRRSVVPVPDDVPAEIAALLGCAVLTGGGAVLNAGRPGEHTDVIVVGLGGVGMAALLVARAVTDGRVIGVDALADKLATARELGADAAYTPDEALAAGLTAPVVIEAAGHPAAFETAFNLTGVGGRTVTVGLPRADARSSIAPLTLTAQARTVIGSYLGSSVPARDIPRYVDMWRAGRLPLERLVSGRVGLEGLNGALDELAQGRALRQIVLPA